MDALQTCGAVGRHSGMTTELDAIPDCLTEWAGLTHMDRRRLGRMAQPLINPATYTRS